MTGLSEQAEQVERQLRRMYADAAAAPIEIDAATAANVIRQGRARRRRTRMTVVGVAAVIAVLAAASITVVPRLVNEVVQPAWRPVKGHGSVAADMVGVWVDSLPSGPVAQAAWVDGDTLHVGSHTTRITGRAITASTPITLYAATEGGWFASVTGPSEPDPIRWGLIQPDGTFAELQSYGQTGAPPMPPRVSPDGSQAVLGGDNSGFLIDTATGRILMHEPDIGAIAWANDGIYAVLPGPEQRVVLWKPGIGITKLSFDAHRCHESTAYTIAANLLAGYSGCKFPQLASTSPDGTHALAGNDVVDLRTGRRIQLAPQKVYGAVELFGGTTHYPSYQVLWQDNEHALIELATPTEPATAAPGTRVQDSFVIVRCNVETGACERASDPFRAAEIGFAPLH